MRIPLINGIRFFKVEFGNKIDWVDEFPSMQNIDTRSDFLKGVNKSDYCQPWPLMPITAYAFEGEDSLICQVNRPERAAIYATKVNINPAGWTGDDYYSFSYTPLNEGFHQLIIWSRSNREFYYRSDLIYVDISNVAPANNKYKLVKIGYTNFENDFGALFYNQQGQFNYTTYFEGHYLPSSPDNEQDVFNDNEGNSQQLSAIGKMGRVLIIEDVPIWYQDQINTIFQCSDLTINGELCTRGNISFEKKPFSDLMKVTVELSLKNNDYYV